MLKEYIAFYQNRLDRGLPADRKSCPYTKEMLQDKKSVCRNMLMNPFEKFERKRFLYYSKELGIISMNHALFCQLSAEDWERIKTQMEEDLKSYYTGMGGL